MASVELLILKEQSFGQHFLGNHLFFLISMLLYEFKLLQNHFYKEIYQPW